MTFGDGADETEAGKIYNLARDNGVNFIDTANVYAGGKSEKIIGNLIKSHREEIVLATKAYFPFEGYAEHKTLLHGRGLNRVHLCKAVDDSLKRLNTDYIDVYYMHRFDEGCSLEETLSTVNDFVRQGKIRYIGLSNFAAWQYMKAVGITRQYNYAPIACIQPMYNLLKRQCESEILPMAESEGLGVFSYSPLAGGFLTGKYHDDGASKDHHRLNKLEYYKKRYSEDRNAIMAGEVVNFARENGYDPISLAIAWVESHPALTAPIIGGRYAEQLKPSLAAKDIEMTDDLRDAISALTIAPEIATDRSDELMS